MTFLATWGYASDFLKMLPKFKMAARVNLTSEIIQILQLHSPQYGDLQVIFQGFAEIQNDGQGSISIFGGSQKLSVVN